MRKLTQEEFLKRTKLANPHLDFSEAVYINKRTKIIVKCPKHGPFTVFPKALFSTLVCPKCDQEVRSQAFIEKAKIIHSDKYDYSKVDYITNKEPVEIVCPKHGSFMQAPGDHLKGYGCSKCSGKYKPTGAEWVKRAMPVYSYKYDYSKVSYVDNKTPVTVTCPIHGDFQTLPTNHLKGVSGCPACNNERKHNDQKKSTEQFIKEAREVHGDVYDYSKVNYYNKNTNVTIICKKHGEFQQIPAVHLIGCGCPKCQNKTQTVIYQYLCDTFKDTNILYEANKSSVPWLGTLRFDIYFPIYNIAIEYDGIQHFIPQEFFGGSLKHLQVKENDSLKNQKCIENHCILIRIKYTYPMNNLKAVGDYIQTIIQNKQLDQEYYETIKYFE